MSCVNVRLSWHVIWEWVTVMSYHVLLPLIFIPSACHHSFARRIVPLFLFVHFRSINAGVPIPDDIQSAIKLTVALRLAFYTRPFLPSPLSYISIPLMITIYPLWFYLVYSAFTAWPAATL